jgi:hypothetical protein
VAGIVGALLGVAAGFSSVGVRINHMCGSNDGHNWEISYSYCDIVVLGIEVEHSEFDGLKGESFSTGQINAPKMGYSEWFPGPDGESIHSRVRTLRFALASLGGLLGAALGVSLAPLFSLPHSASSPKGRPLLSPSLNPACIAVLDLILGAVAFCLIWILPQYLAPGSGSVVLFGLAAFAVFFSLNAGIARLVWKDSVTAMKMHVLLGVAALLLVPLAVGVAYGPEAFALHDPVLPITVLLIFAIPLLLFAALQFWAAHTFARELRSSTPIE